MSTLNMCSPPQTYSRLFRPWDTNVAHSKRIGIEKSAPQIAIMKTEYCASAESIDDDDDDVDIMSSEHSEETGNTDCEDHDCSSSNSSSDPAFDDCYSEKHTPTISSKQKHPLLTDGQSYSSTAYPATAQLRSNAASLSHDMHMQSQHTNHYSQMTMFSGMTPATTTTAANTANGFYYAAAAAAAAANNLSLPPTIPGISSAFNMESYTLGLMEQEYARVMAEEAHIKALNARKQRPKKFKCPHCDVAFSNNGQLKGHIRIHTGERPYKCDVESCGKTFTRNEELTRHKRIHTGLRPFPCPACGKKFGRRDHLKKHMKTHLPQEHPLSGSAAFFVPMYPYMYGL